MESTHQGDLLRDSLQEFARQSNLSFSDYLLLSRAMTHRSYLNEHPEALEDNERLEFLGDAVLDFLVGAWLYNHFPEMAEGELTRLRSALVRTEQLADFAEQIDLGSVMRLGRGEDEGGGRRRPALLCGTFEALVGALYLDAGMDAVQTFIEPFLKDGVIE
ncbi:MAG: ribonuclease III domain-containing protein, partial [Anaerolineales bacterium]